jgi:hypothetical protein
VELINNFYFKTVEGHVRMAKNSQIRVEVPPQMISASESVKITNAADVVQGSATSAIGLSIVVNALLGFGMSNVYEMLNSLQLMATINYMNVFTPANVSSFYGFIIKMAEFDILPMAKIYNSVYSVLNIDIESIISSSPEDEADDRELASKQKSSSSKKKKTDEDTEEIKMRFSSILLSILAIGVSALSLAFFFVISTCSKRSKRLFE